jgi:predicted oxidoreductase (fatty acid repression mutant protein)
VLVATGMTELLKTLPKNSINYSKKMDGYKKMLTTLLHYQATYGISQIQFIIYNSSFPYIFNYEKSIHVFTVYCGLFMGSKPFCTTQYG